MATEPYVPPQKRFPDGSYINYWYSESKGKVIGQLFTRAGRPERGNFTYEGPNPAPWDRERHVMAKCLNCPSKDEFVIAELPLTLTNTAKVLGAATCPHCGADSKSLVVALGEAS